jgi:uncharacterized protein
MRKWFAALLTAAALLAADPGYRIAVEKWRRAHEDGLKADNGWLTVVGLFWLHEGSNTFGSDPSNDIVLPAGSAPSKAGEFDLQRGRTTVHAGRGVTITSNGKAISTMQLRPDTSGHADVIALNRLTMLVIERSGRYGIRLKDNQSAARRRFKGLHWYPVDERSRINAQWIPYDPPKQIPILSIIGTKEKMPSPGYAEFNLGGRKCRLEPVTEGTQELFFIFKDLTSGKETYPAGRFLYSPMPKNGRVLLDFNKAENPPCALTPYATCPLPPKQNYLPVAIRAGELRNHAM